MKRDTWFRVTITTDDDIMAEFIDSYDPFVNPFARSPLS